MAFEETLTCVSAIAAADYSTTGQYLAVKLTATADTVETCDTEGEQIYGVLQNAPGSGEEATVAIAGITKAEAGGTIAIGDSITVAADGQFLDLADGAGTDDIIVGIARSAASAGEIFSLDLRTYLGAG